MAPFKNVYDSHEHSKKTLEILYGYDSFLDSLNYIADLGCGSGLDIAWWAKLETRDDPPEPRNYTCFAVDTNTTKIDPGILSQKNVTVINNDIDNGNPALPRKVDLIWCHDVFQYLIDPMNSLKSWNNQMNINGMLILIFPQTTHYAYNRLQVHGANGVFFNHNIVNLIYMLAVNGFDCNDAYFNREENSPWISAAVYKSPIPPMDPKTTTWYRLAELDLLPTSVVESLTRWGYVKQEDIVTKWLDKDFKFLRS